eukprot:15326058-Ditylum_brightwellii.AAC.1
MSSMSEDRSSNGSQVRQQRRSKLLNATGNVIVLAATAASSSIPCGSAYLALPLHKIAGQRVALSTSVMDMSVNNNHNVSMMPKVTNKNGNSIMNAIKQKLVEEAANKKVRSLVKETDFDSLKSYMKAMANHKLLNKNKEIKNQQQKLHNNTKQNLAQKAKKSTTPTTIELN